MPLLNYTTKIDVEKTIGEITKALSSHGASQIMTDYKDGIINSISFGMSIGEGQRIGFKLPCDWRPVLEVMKQDPKVPARLCDQIQAVRVAWRIVKDWVVAQMALVDTGMVKTEEVFLPYLVTGNGQTLFQKISNDKFMLGNGK